MLDVVGVSKQGNKKSLLSNISLQLEQGRCLVVLGPSGSGKTTFLRTLMGFDAIDKGAILWNSEVLSANGRILVAPEHRHFGMVFQDAALFPHLTVQENVAFGLAHLPHKERTHLAREWLERVGLSALHARNIHTLSGGERQRVALARALAPQPRLLLLDEPFSSVDRLVRQDLLSLLRTLFQETATTAILVTHDARDAWDMGNDVLILQDGEMRQHGKIDEVMASPASEWVQKFLSSGLGSIHMEKNFS